MFEVRVDGLPAGTTEDRLREYFGKYGEVVRALVERDEASGEPKDYGYVWYAEEECARATVADDADHIILGTMVEVTLREPSPVRRNPSAETFHASSNRKKIFVGGLPIGLTLQEFRVCFEGFGMITDAVIITDRDTRKPRGFGFVTFDTEESAMDVLQNRWHLINDKYVEVKPAIPREEASVTEHQNLYLDVYHPPAFASSVDLNGFAPVFPQDLAGFYGYNRLPTREHLPVVGPMMPPGLYLSFFFDNYYNNPANWPLYNGITHFPGDFNAFTPIVPARFPAIQGYNGLSARARHPGIRISLPPQRLNGGDGASSSGPQVDNQPS